MSVGHDYADGQEQFEIDVFILNKSFDDIERFVDRIVSRRELPYEGEFVDVFRKFKRSFNLIAKLQSYIHEPRADELLHFLFPPLQVTLEACQSGHGRTVAPEVTVPLISVSTRLFMEDCLSTREREIWTSLGDAWSGTPAPAA